MSLPTEPEAPALETPDAPPAQSAPRRGLRELLLGERGLPITILVVLLSVIAAYLSLYTAHQFGTDVDGGYYTTIAMNVRDGNGLVSNVSLRHQGFDHFPHPTPIYPLWPLVYGLLAKVFWFAPVASVGKWSSLFFAFVAMVFGYLWTNRLFPRPPFPRILPGFMVGHAFVLLFGLNRNVVLFMTLPFTEGLGFALLMFALWRSVDLLPNPRFAGGLELGLYMALLILVRSPLVLFAAAAIPAMLFAVAAIAQCRRRYLHFGLGAALTFSLLMLARLLHLRSMAPTAGLVEILRWDNIQFSTLLSHPVALKQASGLVALLADRASGLGTAFSPTAKYGYAQQFYTFHYAPFVLLPFLLLLGALRVRRQQLVAGWRWITQPEHLNWILVIGFAVGNFLAIQIMRRSGGKWFFDQRQALPAFFFFFTCFAFLLHSRRVVLRIAAGLLLLSSVVWGGMRTYDRIAKAVAHPKPAPYGQLVSWLEGKAMSDDQLVVAMRQPQLIAWRTPHIGYHTFDNRTRLRDAMAMATKLGVDYFAVPGSFGGFTRSSQFRKSFEQVGIRAGHRLYRLKRRQPEAPRKAEPEVADAAEAEDAAPDLAADETEPEEP